MNPVRGGSPPRESRTRGAREVRAGVFAQDEANEFTLVALFSLKIRNIEKVITK